MTTPKSSTLLWSKRTQQSSCRQLSTPKKVSSRSAPRPITLKELPWIAILTFTTKSKKHSGSEKEKDWIMRAKTVVEGQWRRSTSISMAMETQWRAVAPILIFKAVGWQLCLRELVKIANFTAASSTQATVQSLVEFKRRKLCRAQIPRVTWKQGTTSVIKVVQISSPLKEHTILRCARGKLETTNFCLVWVRSNQASTMIYTMEWQASDIAILQGRPLRKPSQTKKLLFHRSRSIFQALMMT